MLADGVAERKPARRGELRDGGLGEDLVDRTEVELRVGAISFAPCAQHDRLAFLRQENDAGKLAVSGSAIDGRREGAGRIGERDAENELDHECLPL